jgi:hypothetical protein
VSLDVIFGKSTLVHMTGDLTTSVMFATRQAGSLHGAACAGRTIQHVDGGGGDEQEGGEGVFRAKRAIFQKERCAWLAELLRRRLQPWVEGGERAAILHAHHEVTAVRGESLGAGLLRLTGRVWSSAARTAIPRSRSTLRAALSVLEERAEKVCLRAQMSAAIEESEAAAAVNEAEKQLEDWSGEDAGALRRHRRTVLQLGRVWNVAKRDLQQTLREVVRQALADEAGYNVHVKRASGLAAIAAVFERA